MKKIIGLFFAFILTYTFFYARGKTDNYQSETPEYFEENIPPNSNQKSPLYTLREPTGSPINLKESWGYVMQNRLEEYTPELPLTDVCFFAAEINSYGELAEIPNRSRIDTNGARCHLVIICESKSLSHFILDPSFPLRKQLIKDIVKAADPYDGVQIDFELIPGRDRKNYLSFLADLRYSLGKDKLFSVCVPARTKFINDDIFPYAEIAKYCDRVFVMAYDENWSGSKPGPVASINWCRKIMDYAQKSIPENKLVMGIPFYGRTWANETTAGAWYFSGANRIMTEHGTPYVIYENDIPGFKYTTQVEVTGYFNDAFSDVALGRLYENAGIKKMGFWRIGQEDPEFWKWINIEN